MLALQVTFLNGSIAAKRTDDEHAIEWPPHPARLFAALAAAFFEAEEDPAEAHALEWLEALGPPTIWATANVGTPRVIEAFVPVNDVTGLPVLPELRGLHGGKQPRCFVSASLSDPNVIYGWPTEPDTEVHQALARLTARVACLGHSSSLVRVAPVRAPESEPTWRPAPEGSLVLRGPFRGMLQALRHAHARYIRAGIRGPLPAVPYPYAESLLRPARAAPARHGHFSTLWSLRRTDGPVLPILATPGLTAALHRAVLARWEALASQGQLPPIPEEVSGHKADGSPSEQPHVAFVGLPALGHPRSDGHLLGLGLCLPSILSEDARRGLWRVVGEIQSLMLRPQPWSIELVGRGIGTDLPAMLRSQTWCRPARIWASATPVVLDRYPRDLFGPEAENVLRLACERAGLPEPQVATVRPTSLVPGAPPARAFPGYPNGASAPRVHAVLAFSEAIAGPLLVGRGRYRGFGLFYPLEG